MARWSPRALVTTVALTTAVALTLDRAAPVAVDADGRAGGRELGIGVAMTAAYSVAGALLPADAHVTGFGIMTTASLVGLAFSPVLAGFVGASGLRVVFRRRRRAAASGSRRRLRQRAIAIQAPKMPTRDPSDDVDRCDRQRSRRSV